MKEIPQVPSAVTPEIFKKWRSPTRGTANPERMDNPFWKWLIESELGAWQANDLMGGPPSHQAGPCWCFDRYGQTATELPDGRVVRIGGEHEDYYDADFFIYNDVVVTSPDGSVGIYGYPVDVFPPTDFHSATLLDNEILLIGSLSYPDNRVAGQSQVMRLDLESLSISRIETSGDSPGWIHDHTATITDSGRAIIVGGGKVDVCDGKSLIENIDDWRLDLDTFRWERLSKKEWRRFEVYREDFKTNHLWQLRQLQWSREAGWNDVEEVTKKLTESLGGPPNLELVPLLYSPTVADEVLPEDEDEYDVRRIRIGDVIVRYVEDHFVIQVTAEGELPEETMQKLKADLIEKFGLLERAAVRCRDIPSL